MLNISSQFKLVVNTELGRLQIEKYISYLIIVSIEKKMMLRSHGYNIKIIDNIKILLNKTYLNLRYRFYFIKLNKY